MESASDHGKKPDSMPSLSRAHDSSVQSTETHGGKELLASVRPQKAGFRHYCFRCLKLAPKRNLTLEIAMAARSGVAEVS
jgi:hypothetical protein